jgi:pyruvate,water dikinase
LIAGLVTDIGSAISHGSVIAREHGLPCVVNTGVGTKFFQNGDMIRLNGDDGTVTLLERTT